MKSVAATQPEETAVLRSRLADYLELTKPRISVMVLFTVAAGFLLAANGHVDFLLLTHTLCATALVASGASALNQFLERESDALMRRTENRPLPGGRISPAECICFGLTLGLAGLVYLALVVQQPLCVAVAATTFLLYVWVYTPLKKISTLNTLVGAVPGALPPLIGWTAATATVSADGWGLFFVLFLWQVPHFLGIAWLYRDDYGRAGLRMLPVLDGTGRTTGRQMVLYCVALIIASVFPFALGKVGFVYLLGVVLIGLYFLRATIAFARNPGVSEARRVIRASIIYLPVMLLLLLVCSLFP